jgi:protocatechuate 3,4-dioxygenase beta subunit
MEQRITRRRSLVALGGLAAAAAGWRAEDAGAGPAAVASGAVSCVLTPEMTEGPYYIPDEAVRRNITEGLPGVPLALRLTVVSASTCKPVSGAKVDVWHASALGIYSGVQGNTGTFMRGVQPTNAQGVALFETVYPGWYTGRAVHIHVKVHLGGNVVHTGQLFFPDTLTDRVYQRSPYSTRSARDTRNATDAIFRNGGSRSMLKVARSGSGYVGAIVLGVHRT